MREQFTITFVCTGNTCRSPMAEVIARNMLLDKEITSVTVRSAGILAGEGQGASAGARWAASEGGLDLDGHRATLLTDAMVGDSDLILTMGKSHQIAVQELGGGDRVHRLRDFAGEHGDILDPFGGPDHVYQATFREIRGLVEKAVARLQREGVAV